MTKKIEIKKLPYTREEEPIKVDLQIVCGKPAHSVGSEHLVKGKRCIVLNPPLWTNLWGGQWIYSCKFENGSVVACSLPKEIESTKLPFTIAARESKPTAYPNQ